MKNKALIVGSIGLGVIAAVLIGFYFVGRNKSTVDSLNAPANKTAASLARNQAPTENQRKLVTDDFEVALPAGWERTEPAIGASAMAVNRNEKLDDPAAQRINFRSYFAVSYDTLQGKIMSEYLQTVKNGLSQTIANVVFTNERDIMINGRSARAIEAELTQQGVNFKILMVIVAGQGEDVWVMSFNTTKSGWDGYKEAFSDIAKSFSLKK